MAEVASVLRLPLVARDTSLAEVTRRRLRSAGAQADVDVVGGIRWSSSAAMLVAPSP